MHMLLFQFNFTFSAIISSLSIVSSSSSEPSSAIGINASSAQVNITILLCVQVCACVCIRFKLLIKIKYTVRLFLTRNDDTKNYKATSYNVHINLLLELLSFIVFIQKGWLLLYYNNGSVLSYYATFGSTMHNYHYQTESLKLESLLITFLQNYITFQSNHSTNLHVKQWILNSYLKE